MQKLVLKRALPAVCVCVCACVASSYGDHGQAFSAYLLLKESGQVSSPSAGPNVLPPDAELPSEICASLQPCN